jgi:CD2 antigen cytoplasmic tail-binding protein 2
MSRPQPRPKRAAEDFTRTQDHSSSQGPSKKPRFDTRNPSALAPDALDEDAVLEADVIGARGQQVKRNAVNIDGYDSDSDNDNFNARAERNAKLKERAEKDANRKVKSKDEEDADMFADLEDDFHDGDDSEGNETRRTAQNNKKAVRFIDADQIEGQVSNSKSGGHVSADFTLNNGKGNGRVDKDAESSSDSEVDDETRADVSELDPELGAGSKKHHAPKLDAFNIRNETEEGQFDDQGNYVRKAADPDAVHDVWLEGTSKKEMKKAKDAAEKREEDRRRRDLEDDAKATGDVLGELIPLLQKGETVLEALARLGKGKQKDKKHKWQIKNKKQSNGHAEDHAMAEDDPAEKARKEAVEAITGAADFLFTKGQPEVYDTERELLMRQYKRETGRDWEDLQEASNSNDPAQAMVQLWEYRWTDARDGGASNGPYDANTMKAWNDAGYFGEGVEFRSKDGGDSWSRVADFA